MTQLSHKELESIAREILSLNPIFYPYSPLIISNHHNTNACVFRLLSSEGIEKILKIEISKNPKLKKEIFFILNNFNQNIYPRILAYGKISEYIQYCIMESLFLDHNSFSELYELDRLTENHIAALIQLLEEITFKSKIVNQMSSQMYNKYYIGRFKERIKILETSFMKDLLRYKFIYINDKQYLNLIQSFEATDIKNTKLDFKFISAYPGDLHFDHIFINSSGTLKVIDPKGTSYLPLEYDLGKTLHSLHGDYNILHSLKFEIKKTRTNSISITKYRVLKMSY